MKYKLSTCLLLIPFFVSSQINSSLDFVIGIESSNRSLSTSDEDATIASIIDSRSAELRKMNWRIGVNYNKRLFNNFVLKTGIRLASVGYKDEKKTDLRWPSEFNGNGWTPDPTLIHEIQLRRDYWFAEVPIIGRYEFNSKKLSPFIEMGIAPSYYITTRNSKVTDLGSDNDFQHGGNQNFNNLHIVGVLSAGVNYMLNPQLQFFGQSSYRYHFTKLVDAPINEYLYNFGIELGIRMNLEKLEAVN